MEIEMKQKYQLADCDVILEEIILTDYPDVVVLEATVGISVQLHSEDWYIDSISLPNSDPIKRGHFLFDAIQKSILLDDVACDYIEDKCRQQAYEEYIESKDNHDHD